MNTHFVLFDLEMTCWESDYPKRNREIIEIAAVLLNPFGKELSRFERLVKPEVHPRLSFYCKNLTGIQQSDVDNAISFIECHKAFTKWLQQHDSDKVYVAWGARDERMLEDSCHMYRLESVFDGPYMDAKQVYHDLKKRNYKIGLIKAMKYEGLEFEGEAHRAMPDTLNMARLFRKYLGEWPV